MKTSCQAATLFGIPIRLDLSLLVLMGMLWFGCFNHKTGGLADFVAAFIVGTTWALLLLLSIILHELGHCLVSMEFGCRVRGITLMLLGGRAELSHIPTQPAHELLIAIAGPLVSLALWLGGRYGAVYFASQPPGALMHYASGAMADLAWLNITLFWFNLVPAFPMDGGRILRALLAHALGRLHATRIAVQLGRLLAVGTLIWIMLWKAKINVEAHQWAIAGWQWPSESVHLTLNRVILGLIALFVLFAAQQEYRTVLAEAEYQRNGKRAPWLPPLAPEDRIVVSPPPYHSGSVDYRPHHEIQSWWQWWQ